MTFQRCCVPRATETDMSGLRMCTDVWCGIVRLQRLPAGARPSARDGSGIRQRNGRCPFARRRYCRRFQPRTCSIHPTWSTCRRSSATHCHVISRQLFRGVVTPLSARGRRRGQLDRQNDSDVDPRTSFRMKRVRRRDTAPEMVVRRVLFGEGYRYRVHVEELPGRPDIVFAGRRKAIFVHGCFWHGHEGCTRGSLPKRRREYWSGRVRRNGQRDLRVATALRTMNWSVCVVWECETRDHRALVERLSAFLDT